MAAGGTCSLERVTHISQVIRRRRRHMNPCGGGGGGGGAGGGPYRVSRRSRGRPDTHSAALREHEARVLDRMLEACGGKDSCALRVAAAGARAICGYRHAADGRRGAPHAAPRSHRPRSQWRHTCAGACAGACGTRVRVLHARAAHARCGTAHVPLWRNIWRTHGDAWHMLYARHTLHGRAVAALPRYCY